MGVFQTNIDRLMTHLQNKETEHSVTFTTWQAAPEAGREAPQRLFSSPSVLSRRSGCPDEDRSRGFGRICHW